MTRFFLLIIAVVLFSCSDRAEKPSVPEKDSTEVMSEAFQFNAEFPELYQYLSSQDSTFDPQGFDQGELTVQKNNWQDGFEPARLQEYLPYLIFNADSTYALDLVTYNYAPRKKGDSVVFEVQGPDFEVGLIDWKNRRRKRLLFFGPSGPMITDARWKDSTTALLAGIREWPANDSLRPLVLKYDVANESWEQFEYPSHIRAEWKSYAERLPKHR